MQFDFIIVGAGSAGSVPANRLTANFTDKVCLIKSGLVDLSPYIHILAGFIKLVKNKKFN